MTERTWIGGGNNRASNPAHWSPNQVPSIGDTLFVGEQPSFPPPSPPYPSYTMNVRGYDLAGDPLSIGYADTTINMSHAAYVAATVNGGTLTDPTNQTFNLSQLSDLALTNSGYETSTVNIRGSDLFTSTLSGIGGTNNVIVNLAPNATWFGHFSMEEHYASSTVTINPGSGSTFVNDGASNLSYHSATVPLPVLGDGSFSIATGKLEFTDSVGPGQSVSVNAPFPGATTILQVDQPSQFLASTTLQGGGVTAGGTLYAREADIDLQGLASADSATYQQNDLLSLYSGGALIDTLRMNDATDHGFVVQNTGSSVNVVAITDPSNPPTQGVLLKVTH